MTIKQLLKSYPARITMYDKWLVIFDEKFLVYEHKPYAKKTTIVYSGNSESKAVEALVN
ncbi:MAG TPA: hypothetical protein VJ438_03180 [Candidatus Nanoarchaeia archaeon]|nr:hypothetical protein [Candidatus Nanoarchaeia archaeon]